MFADAAPACERGQPISEAIGAGRPVKYEGKWGIQTEGYNSNSLLIRGVTPAVNFAMFSKNKKPCEIFWLTFFSRAR